MTTNTEPDEGGTKVHVHTSADGSCGYCGTDAIDCPMVYCPGCTLSDVRPASPAQVAASVPPAAPGATESASGPPSAWEVLSEAALQSVVALRQQRDAARSTAALAVEEEARLRERIAALADLVEGRMMATAKPAELRALLAPEDDAPAAAQCEDCEHSGHLPGGCEDYSDEPPDGGPCECMTDSTALRALLAEGGEGGE